MIVTLNSVRRWRMARETRSTNRWPQLGFVAIVLVAFGLIFFNVFLLLSAVAVLLFVPYSRYDDSPNPEVEVTRSIDSTDPAPGDEVEVRVTVENLGERKIRDLKINDDPPLPVVSGKPRLYTALGPRDSESFSYILIAKRGKYRFESPDVVVRNLTKSKETTIDSSVEGESRLNVEISIDDIVYHERSSSKTGQLTSNQGGPGIEFHSSREYRHNDPMRRIDWSSYAKTRELKTINFDQERSAKAGLFVDMRGASRKKGSEDGLDAVEYSIYAAEQVSLQLLSDGNACGLYAYPGPLSILSFAGGEKQITRALRFFNRQQDFINKVYSNDDVTQFLQKLDIGSQQTRHQQKSEKNQSPKTNPHTDKRRSRNWVNSNRGSGSGSGVGGSGSGAAGVSVGELGYRYTGEVGRRGGDVEGYLDEIDRIHTAVPRNSQIYVFSPLLDDGIVELVGSLKLYNYSITVVSPDVTRMDGLGRKLVGIERRRRVESLEGLAYVSVVDWDPGEPLSVAISRHERVLR